MLLTSFCINYKNVFDLILTGDNTKNTKNTVTQRKYKKCSIFVVINNILMLTSAKYCEGNIYVYVFLKKFLNYISYLVSLPSFKCLAFSHQK